MREINSGSIRDKIAQMVVEANITVDKSITDSFEKNLIAETNPLAKEILVQLIENYKVAREENLPICQDTGCVAVFVEMGQDAHITGGNIGDMINEGVRIGYRDGYLRKSMVSDPLMRQNTGDNTPAIIHYEIVPGDKLKITVMPKGAGCENMCRIAMLKPTQGIDAVKKFVLDTVFEAGPNPCPPLFIGVGIGGSFEKSAYLAKKALILPFYEHSPLPHIAQLEDDLLKSINELDIGPQGMGGKTTALGIRVLTYPTHIASLPVAVNISCHALRFQTAEF